MSASRIAWASTLLGLLLALPAVAAEQPPVLTPDPTWQQVDPAWLQGNWKWHAAPPAPAARAVARPHEAFAPMAVSPPVINPDMQAALATAAARGDMAQVKSLVARGANINLRDQEGYSALTWAAQRGNAAVVDYLLTHFANPNPLDRGGYTPLMWAAQEGYPGVASLLLDHGANPFVKDSRGITALALANISHNADLVKRIQAAMQTSPAARRPLPTPP